MSSNEHKLTLFVSDLHLGIDAKESSTQREIHFCRWLNKQKDEIHQIFLVGDIFDYWFEYKHVVPKGYFRLFSCLSELSSMGISIHYLKGNHDQWHYGYLQSQLGITIHDGPIEMNIGGHNFFIAHGDGLGQGDLGYKLIRSILKNPIAQWIFACIHPFIGIPLMRYMSAQSRDGRHEDTSGSSRLQDYATEIAERRRIDYFICGHVHDPQMKTLDVNRQTIYCNLGDWITHYTYATWDGKELSLGSFPFVEESHIARPS